MIDNMTFPDGRGGNIALAARARRHERKVAKGPTS
jgi:hypothetical protein